MRLAFGYKSRVGKDTCVEYLISKYGGKKVSFASPLYNILHYAQRACGFPEQKDRKFLQYVGTEWARNQCNNVWLDKVSETLKADSTTNMYISDLRFLNEFESLRRQNVTLIRIDSKRALIDDHESSTSLDSVDADRWDYIVENSSSLQDLYTSLDSIVTDLNKGTHTGYGEDFVPGVSIDQKLSYKE